MSPVCDRCQEPCDIRYPHIKVDEETGKKTTMRLCWNCDFDIINGRGSLEDEPWEVQEQHEEEDYECDPLYYPPPRWMREKETAK